MQLHVSVNVHGTDDLLAIVSLVGMNATVCLSDAWLLAVIDVTLSKQEKVLLVGLRLVREARHE